MCVRVMFGKSETLCDEKKQYYVKRIILCYESLIGGNYSKHVENIDMHESVVGVFVWPSVMLKIYETLL